MPCRSMRRCSPVADRVGDQNDAGRFSAGCFAWRTNRPPVGPAAWPKGCCEAGHQPHRRRLPFVRTAVARQAIVGAVVGDGCASLIPNLANGFDPRACGRRFHGDDRPGGRGLASARGRRPISRRPRPRTRRRRWGGIVVWSRRAILDRGPGRCQPRIMDHGHIRPEKCKEHDRPKENFGPLLFATIFPTGGRWTAVRRLRPTASDLVKTDGPPS